MRTLILFIGIVGAMPAHAEEYAFYVDNCTGLTGQAAKECEAMEFIVDGKKLCRYRAPLAKNSNPLVPMRIPDDKQCPVSVRLKRSGNGTITAVNPYDEQK